MKLCNYKRDRILFFSDSRGFLVGDFISYKNGFKNPLVDFLVRNFCADIKINQYKHTTYLDFIRDFNEKNLEKYKHIILILGVVDFSSRSAVDAQKIRIKKLSLLPSDVPTSSSYKDASVVYDGEITDSIINKEIEALLIKRLENFKHKIILINTGCIDPKWSGNYWRDRPKNMNVFLARERKFAQKISNNVIDVSGLTPKKYTIDNIHYSKDGFKILLNKIRRILV